MSRLQLTPSRDLAGSELPARVAALSRRGFPMRPNQSKKRHPVVVWIVVGLAFLALAPLQNATANEKPVSQYRLFGPKPIGGATPVLNLESMRSMARESHCVATIMYQGGTPLRSGPRACVVAAMCDAIDGKPNYFGNLTAMRSGSTSDRQWRAMRDFVRSCRDVEQFGPALIRQQPKLMRPALQTRNQYLNDPMKGLRKPPPRF